MAETVPSPEVIEALEAAMASRRAVVASRDRLVALDLLLKQVTVEDDDDALREAAELTAIFDRFDRELAVEDARADRLLRLYNL